MLDDSFPTYRLHPVKEDALQTSLLYTYNGSDPTRAYTLRRPSPSSSANQYALALFDAHNQSVIYGEVLVKPEWPQPTLSAADIRNQNGSPPIVPITPDSFSVLLYNPDQNIVVTRNSGGWNRTDSWGFEMPERTFKLPSASKLDQETGRNEVSDLSPKIMFHWKRDGRLNKDMTCYMSGKSVGGKKSKEPDITVAMYRSEKHGDAVCIYEPNMARVEVEDRKGLEVVLLLSAVVVRDLHFAPRQNPFNVSGAVPAGAANVKARRGSRPLAPSPNDPTLVSGALGDTPSPAPAHTPPAKPSPANNAAKQAEIDAETRRLQAMVAQEERQRRERLAREEEEKTRKMLQQEEAAQRRWKQAEIDAETERLRREYGVPAPRPTQPSPPLPQRPLATTMSGALNNSSWHGPPAVNNLRPPPPPRPSSVGPGPYRQPQQNGRNNLAPSGPYSGPSAARASALSFFGGGKTDEEKRKKMKKKQSVHF
ncbi:hypothetical protein TARUN_694 [Trichoderma arundinaceum]|uniref:Reticulocyte-binding 2 like a n=1 Tax=Trichoderma arundinaceum TaxID=490622 RepID=A0A395NZL2_TRIAR|nr:hypothetical protein TARUN_694 [Trichoderma arundinaceum]